MLMGIIDQDLLEERAAGTEDHLVRLDLLVVIAGQSYVTEVILVEMIPEGLTRALVKLFPGQLVSLCSHGD